MEIGDPMHSMAYRVVSIIEFTCKKKNENKKKFN